MNGHVSGVCLKSENDGDLCLACHEPIVLGPLMGETEFAKELIALETRMTDDHNLEELLRNINFLWTHICAAKAHPIIETRAKAQTALNGVLRTAKDAGFCIKPS